MNQLAKLRLKAFQIQQCRCYYCSLPMWEAGQGAQFAVRHGLSPKLTQLLRCTAEHLQARQDGGKDAPTNIAAVCHFCNLQRHAGRAKMAPEADKYKLHIKRRMAKGAWHPANGRV